MIPPIPGEDTTETRTGLPPSQDATLGGASSTAPALPAFIDRFRVLGRIGVGGMGTVFEAFDPELDRKIAIKLLAGEHGPEDNESKRLLREARSLAQISHPNVVEIYGTGIDAGRVWLAMELVEGRTLKQWAAENPPGTRAQRDAAVDLLRQAAAGLSAAHARGLTHRDFKPANALVGNDGRVRVVDFGLAVRQLAPNEKDLAQSVPDPSSSALQTYDDAITRTGAVLGTPRYMAPEQHRGEPSTPRADQFAFAVTAWELLYGEPPFELQSIAAIYDAILSRRFRETQSQHVPRWMHRVLRKALHPAAEHRYRSMEALARALEGRTRRRRFVAAGLAVGLSSAGLIAAWPIGALHPVERTESCESLVRHRFDSVWTPDARTRIQAAVAATGVPFAAESETTLELAVGRYRDEWISAATTVCTANIAGVLEGSCIDEDLQVFGRVLSDAEQMTAKKAERLGSAFDTLPTPSRCLAEAGDAQARSVDPSQTRRLSDAKVAFSVGDRERAKQLTREVVEATDSWSILADALILQGRVLKEDDPRSAAEAWERAYALAVEHDASVLAADAAWHLALRRADERDREGAEGWERRRNAEVSRVENWSGPSEEHLRCLLLDAFERYDLARPVCERAFAALSGEVSSEGVRQIRTALGNVYERTGQTERALQLSLEQYEANLLQLGPAHPSTGGMLMNVGNAYAALGRYAEAADSARRAGRVFARAYGETNRWVLSAAMNEATQYQRQGKLELADAVISDLLPKLANEGVDDLQAARIMTNLASIRIDQRRYEEALALLARVRGLESAALRPDDSQLAFTFAGEMWAQCGLHRWDDALAAANEALRIRERTGEVPKRLPVLRGRILILRRLGRLDDARAEVSVGLELLKSLPASSELGFFHLNGALVEFDAGDLDAAAKHLDHAAASTDPTTSPEGRAGLRFLQARLAYERGDASLEAARAALVDAEARPLLFFPPEEARAWVEQVETVRSRRTGRYSRGTPR